MKWTPMMPSGHRINDINSLAEYVHDVILKRGDKPREDEDRRQCPLFSYCKACQLFFRPAGHHIAWVRGAKKRTINAPFHLIPIKNFIPFFTMLLTPPPRFIG